MATSPISSEPARQVRSGATLGLLSDERIVLIELARRAPPRDCVLPESTFAAGGRLVSLAFDQVSAVSAGHLLVIWWLCRGRAGGRLLALLRALLTRRPPSGPLASLQHVPQLLYASTSDGAVMVFNSRSRAPPPEPEAEAAGGSGRKAAPTVECRWLDTLAAQPGRADEPAVGLGAVRGYLFAVGATTLQASARCVPTLSAPHRGPPEGPPECPLAAIAS